MRSARIPSPRRALAAVLTVAALTALAPAAAHAAVAAPERVTAISPSNSLAKGQNVSCPAGKRALGAAGRLVNGSGQVVLDDMAPNAGLTGATAFGAEDGNGFSQDWLVISEAICATPPAGLQLVTATSPTNSSSKGVTATCPTGKRVVGTGADLAGGLGQVVLDDIAPNAGLTAVTAFGAEDGNGHSGSWSIRAHAVCANPPAGLQRVAATSASNSAGSGKTQAATCPTGKDLLGLGVELTGGGGQVLPTELNPRSDLTGVDLTAYEDEDGQAANWSLTAYAICANGSQRGFSDFEHTAGGLSGELSMTVGCPAGKAPTGGGFDLTGGLGRVLVRAFVPSETVWATATRHESGDAYTLRTYPICATPLPGLQVVSAESPDSTVSPKSVTVPCPEGKQVVGTGALVFGPDDPLIDGVIANSGLTAVTATGSEGGNGADDPWQVHAYAICANPPPGLQRVTASTPLDEEEIKSITATCPAGKNLLGTGVQMPGANGRVALDDLRPNAGLTSNTVTGIETEFGNPGDWSITAHAICANP